MYYVGTSGWVYKHWREKFYPKGVPQTRWLEYYAERFSTVELNASFYRLPTEKAFEGWRDRTPDGFCFAVKASRLITHMKKLHDCEEALDLLLSRGRRLGSRLGPVLFQLPPSWKVDIDRLEGFLRILPNDISAVFEFREPTWYSEEVLNLLESHNAGFCIHDMRGLETPIRRTSDMIYVRFHGPGRRKYTGSYSDEDLEAWAERLDGLMTSDTRLFAYFNNDIGANAIRNAESFRRILDNK
jgi:uncharacterized protein YecE (DUF72 family)